MSGGLTRVGEASPPGCRRRKVVMIEEPRHFKLRGFGKVLKLDCGHSQWVAGWPDRLPDGIRELERPCLESPCYQLQTQMGKHA